MEEKIDLNKYIRKVKNLKTLKINGKVTQVVGLVIEGLGPGVSVGETCKIVLQNGLSSIEAEVVGFKQDKILLMPLGEPFGIAPGNKIIAQKKLPEITLGESLLGRIIDGLGNPMDGKGQIEYSDKYPLYGKKPHPLKKRRIDTPIDLGIRAINGLLTCGKGQRIGIYSGSGVGKSSLLGMIARNTEAEVNIIALIGERNREVREFIEKNLKDGLSHSVVVVATSDQSPLIRVRAAFLATTIAEYFRDVGKQVILMMDSITRFATAQREIGLTIGEPPTTKGYPPSVFTYLPKLLERSGTGEDKGSITGIYTVLVEGDDMDDPIADSTRAILDGHIVLSRRLANSNHYPAIDILNSNSRLCQDIIEEKHLHDLKNFVELLSIYYETEDLLNIGAYTKGSNPKIDRAVSLIGNLKEYLRQDLNQRVTLSDSKKELSAIF
ncbi:MAG: FliI/YscN family ATPase [Thermodesulfobacteriota bacterium]|nr:FliI/YscN family ATPase [Thermodesulfobacteriota bacterium]